MSSIGSSSDPQYELARVRLSLQQTLPRLDKEDPRRSSEKDYYATDPTKSGSGRLISRQPPETKDLRHVIKQLLVRYLQLKFELLEQETESSPPGKMKPINLICRFRIKKVSYEMETDVRIEKYRIYDSNKNVVHLRKDSWFLQPAVISRIFNGSQLDIVDPLDKVRMENPNYWSIWQFDGIYPSYGICCRMIPSFLRRPLVNLLNKTMSPSPPWEEYRQLIHPILTQATVQILNNLKLDRPRVMELCGGNGILAHEIIQEYSKGIAYTILENNAVALESAENYAQNLLYYQQLTPVNTNIVRDQDYFIDREKTTPISFESVDLIIGSGALTECVLQSKEDAMEVLKKCERYLKSGGYMVLAGHGPSLLTTDDFESHGFIVINSYLAGYYKGQYRFNGILKGYFKNFYILQKN